MPILAPKLTDLAPFWEASWDFFAILGAILQKMAEPRKTTTVHHFYKFLKVSGMLSGGFLGTFCVILALCWAMLDHYGR